MVEDERVAKVNSIWFKVRDRKNSFDSRSALVINTLTKNDGGLGKIWRLTRGITERFGELN